MIRTYTLLARNQHLLSPTTPTSLRPFSAMSQPPRSNGNTNGNTNAGSNPHRHRRSKRPRLAGPTQQQGQVTTAAVRHLSTAVTATATTGAPAPAFQTEPEAPKPANANNRHFTSQRFAEAPISDASKAGITHEFMSDVQASTLAPALEGKDLLVQAKTGTGKTIAFLLPAIERLHRDTRKRHVKDISILVLSPTRELAQQIEKEAKTLLQFHDLHVQLVIGGTNPASETTRLATKPCNVLIATPGRLLDHLQNGALANQLQNLNTVVYDEADRLLDQGFKPALDAIMRYLGDGVQRQRQALLFSATVSDEIKKIAAAALRPGYSFISTLRADEVNTHHHVEQSYFLAPQSMFLHYTMQILVQDSQLHPRRSKGIVFFPTARQVALAAAVLEKVPGLPKVHEIHSRKSQGARTRVAEEFGKATEGVLLSSDVTARGMDFPDVTLVLQVGVPSNAEQYIHRLGRTARAGASGRGVLILSREESFFVKSGGKNGIRDLPLTLLSSPPSPTSTSAFTLPAPPTPHQQSQYSQILSSIPADEKAQAYRAWLGYYRVLGGRMGLSSAEVVQEANRLAVEGYGWDVQREGGLPGVEARLVGKMGLKGVPGLNIVKAAPRDGDSGRGGRPGRGGRGGGRS